MARSIPASAGRFLSPTWCRQLLLDF
jgi:hypothetical protein